MDERSKALVAALLEHMRLLDAYAKKAGFSPEDYAGATAKAEAALQGAAKPSPVSAASLLQEIGARFEDEPTYRAALERVSSELGARP